MEYKEIMSIAEVGDRIVSEQLRENTIYSHILLKDDSRGSFKLIAFVKNGDKHRIYKRDNSLDVFNDWEIAEYTARIHTVENGWK